MARIGTELPEGALVSFGVCGALVDGLSPGTVVSARRLVDEAGETLWEGEPLALRGACTVVACAAGQIVDDPGERAALAARTGAHVVDLESAMVAETGRLAGVLRAVSDVPGRPLGRLAHAVTPEGRTDAAAVLRALALDPVGTVRAGLAARRGVAALEGAARALASR